MILTRRLTRPIIHGREPCCSHPRRRRRRSLDGRPRTGAAPGIRGCRMQHLVPPLLLVGSGRVTGGATARGRRQRAAAVVVVVVVIIGQQGAQGVVGAPGVFEGGGGEVVAVGGGDGGPEVQAVGVVQAVQEREVDVLAVRPPLRWGCVEPEPFRAAAADGCGGAAAAVVMMVVRGQGSVGDVGAGQDGLVGEQGGRVRGVGDDGRGRRAGLVGGFGRGEGGERPLGGWLSEGGGRRHGGAVTSH